MLKMTRAMALKYAPRVLVGGSAALGFVQNALAQAASNDYGAVAQIASLQATALLILGAFLTFGIAFWGASYIIRRFFPKGK